MMRSLFTIYPGEEKNALSFALLGFLWSFAVSLGWKNADALFILNVGAEELPKAYSIISGFMIVIASIMLYSYNRYAVHKIFWVILSLGIIFYSFAYSCFIYGFGEEAKWFWYTLRVFGWIFFSVVNTCFWTFIDQFYHIRDSKRLFSLFTSAVFVGIACTGILMNAGALELSSTMLLIILILTLTFYWIVHIVKYIQPIHMEYPIEVAASPSDHTWRKTLSSILRSKFTIYLMAFSFIGYVSMFLTEYNYMVAFENAFGGGPEFTMPVETEEEAPLMTFLGKCIAGVSVFNIIFGLFFYSRLVRRFGVNNLLLITPLFLVFTYMGWPFSSSLFFPVMAFFICESTFYVIDDNNFNLLLNGVPSKIKYKIRVFIESFFEPIGTLTCAILLTVVPIDARLIALCLGIALLIISFMARQLYPKSIYTNLMENAVHFEKTPKEWLSTLSKKERKSSELRLLAILKMGDIKAHDFALEGLIDFADPSIIDKLLTLIDELSPKTKEIFIEKIGNSPFAREMRIIDHLSAWDQDEIDPDLRATLHLYLAKHGLLSPQKALLDLKSSDPKLKCAALIALKKSSAYASPYYTVELRSLAAQHLQELLSSEDEQANLMGLNVLSVDASPEDVNILIPFLNHASLSSKRQTARAIAQIASPQAARHAKTLLSYIVSQSDNEFRLSLIEALGKMADTTLVHEILEASVHLRPNERRMIEKIIFDMGLRNVPTLLSIAKDSSLHDRSRLLAGRILGRLALPQLRANLVPIVSNEIDRAFFYFYHYHTIQKSYPEYDLHVLKDTLLARYYSVLDFIIQMLGVAGEIEDSELLFRTLRSHNPKVRSQVIETLERTCEKALFRLIQPLVDELPLEVKFKMHSTPHLTLEELLENLRTSPSMVDQIAAAAVSSTLQLPGWKKTLKQQMAGKEEIFHHFAYELLES